MYQESIVNIPSVLFVKKQPRKGACHFLILQFTVSARIRLKLESQIDFTPLNCGNPDDLEFALMVDIYPNSLKTGIKGVTVAVVHDNACSRHMTGNKLLLSDMSKVTPIEISVADGKIIVCDEVGSMK